MSLNRKKSVSGVNFSTGSALTLAAKTTYLIEGPPGSNQGPGETIVEKRIFTGPEVPRSVRDWDVMQSERGRSPSPGNRTVRSGRSRRRSSPPQLREEIFEKREVLEVSPSRTHRTSRSRRRSSPVVIERRDFIEDDRDESSSFHAGPLAIIGADRHRSKSDREIKDEIRRLETERRLLRDERRTHRRIREGGESEVIIERAPGEEVVEIRKDRKGRMSIVK